MPIAGITRANACGVAETLPTPLTTSQDANAARAWRFAAILQSVTGARRNRWADLFQSNVDRVARELSRVLQQLGGSPGSPVAGIAVDVGLLALRAGSQRAHVLVETCEFGDRGDLLGDWFGHENEGAAPPGPVLVDLMVQPCLRRVGDGHEDTRSQKILVPGVFLAQK